MSKARTQRIEVRVAPEDRRLFDEAAAAADESLSEFIVMGGRDRARNLLADRTSFALDEQAWRAFNEELDRPPRMNDGIERLLARERPE